MVLSRNRGAPRRTCRTGTPATPHEAVPPSDAPSPCPHAPRRVRAARRDWKDHVLQSPRGSRRSPPARLSGWSRRARRHGPHQGARVHRDPAPERRTPHARARCTAGCLCHAQRAAAWAPVSPLPPPDHPEGMHLPALQPAGGGGVGVADPVGQPRLDGRLTRGGNGVCAPQGQPAPAPRPFRHVGQARRRPPGVPCPRGYMLAAWSYRDRTTGPRAPAAARLVQRLPSSGHRRRRRAPCIRIGARRSGAASDRRAHLLTPLRRSGPPPDRRFRRSR